MPHVESNQYSELNTNVIHFDQSYTSEILPVNETDHRLDTAAKSIFKTKSLKWTFLRPMATIICKQYYLICIFPLRFWNIVDDFASIVRRAHNSNDNMTTANRMRRQNCAHFISTEASLRSLLIISLFVHNATIVRKWNSYLSDRNEWHSWQLGSRRLVSGQEMVKFFIASFYSWMIPLKLNTSFRSTKYKVISEQESIADEEQSLKLANGLSLHLCNRTFVRFHWIFFMGNSKFFFRVVVIWLDDKSKFD